MKIDILPNKNIKIGTLSLRSMENFSRPDFRTVSRIQFKLGPGIEHPSSSTRHATKVRKSTAKSMTSRNLTG